MSVTSSGANSTVDARCDYAMTSRAAMSSRKRPTGLQTLQSGFRKVPAAILFGLLPDMSGMLPYYSLSALSRHAKVCDRFYQPCRLYPSLIASERIAATLTVKGREPNALFSCASCVLPRTPRAVPDRNMHTTS